MRLRPLPVLVLTALVLLCTACVALLTAPGAPAWVLDGIVRRSEGRLSYASVQGSVLTGISVRGLEVRIGETATLHVASASARWRVAPLLLGRLQVVTLELGETTVTLREGAPEPQPLRLPLRLELPVHVGVESLTVSDLRLVTVAGDMLRLGALSAQAGADQRGLRVEGLRVEGPWLTAHGDLALAARHPFAASGQLALSLRPPSAPVWQADLGVGGDLERLTADLRVRAPLTATLALALQSPLDARELSGRFTATDTALAGLHPRAPALTAGADLELSGRLRAPLSLDARGEVRLDIPGVQSTPIRVDARLVDGVLSVEHATARLVAPLAARLSARARWTLRDGTLDGALLWQDLVWPDATQPLTVSPQGQVRMAGDPGRLSIAGSAAPPGGGDETVTIAGWLAPSTTEHELSLDWPALTAPAGLASPVRLAAGRLTSRGTLADPALGITSVVDGGPFAGTAFTLDARRAGAQAMVADLTLHRAATRGTGRLRYAWQPAGSLDLDLRFTGFDPALLHADFPGSLAGQLSVRASAAAGGWDANLRLSGLSGALRGQAVRGAAEVGWHPGRWAPRSLALEFGAARLTLGPGPDGGYAWRATVPDLAPLLPEARGRLDSHGRIAGDWRDPELDLALEGTGLAWRDWAVGRISAKAGNESGVRRLVLEAETLDLGGFALDRLEAQAQGTPQDHRVETRGTRGDQSLVTELTGAWSGDRWSGALAGADLDLADLGVWRLAAPAGLTLEAEALELQSACWVNGEAQACLAGRAAAADWRIEAGLQRLELASLAPLLPGGLRYTGRFDGRVWARGGGAPPAALAELTLSAGSVSQSLSSGVRELLAFRSGEVRTALADHALEGGVRLDLADAGELDVALATRTDGAPGSRPLRGRARVHMRDFALVPVLVPELSRFAGRLDAGLELGGTLEAPYLRGTANFRDGVATVPRLGLELDQVTLGLSGDGDRVQLTGGARADGQLGWRGELARSDDGWRGELTVQGERFRALNLPEARVTVSPDLRVTLAGHELRLTGTLRVPSARLEPRDLAGAVTASEDQVIVQHGGRERAAGPWRLNARLRTVLGDDVRFDGFGLRGRVTGEIVATDTPDQLTLASGELAISDGHYEAYGQQLDIERGRLLFTGGPLNDPGMDVRATRLIEEVDGVGDVTVGVNIRGTLRRPQTSLFAVSPVPLDESQQLSLLVLGHLLEAADEEDQAALDDARGRLGLTTGGAYLARALGRQLGIEDVRIRNSGDRAQLVLGKYLSPRLYLSYGIGLFLPINTVRLRYQLSPRWSVEAESGEENAADFKYTIEK